MAVRQPTPLEADVTAPLLKAVAIGLKLCVQRSHVGPGRPVVLDSAGDVQARAKETREPHDADGQSDGFHGESRLKVLIENTVAGAVQYDTAGGPP